ncbi:signal peptidase I [Tersicoccus sp. Bi-70]|uniref:signal peptidase I n=1 Tax=Tersicoccus sp. Bi-70 TaxID=1897634 RepID=UPI001E318D0F|nr:signal peptidase I [Tersicoccus sp. Bi-70]
MSSNDSENEQPQVPGSTDGRDHGSADLRPRGRHTGGDRADTGRSESGEDAAAAAERPTGARPTGAQRVRHLLAGRRSDGTALSGGASFAREVAGIVVVALVLSFLIKTFLFRAYFIPSQSMEQTLQVDDRIFVNLLVPKVAELHRGDIIVFKDSNGWLQSEPIARGGARSALTDVLVFLGLAPDDSQQHLVKRVIGMPGDHVTCCDTQGRLTVNGKSITEPYLNPGSAPSDTKFDIVVPEGKLWVMGDHRDNSADSRAHVPSAAQPSAEPFVSIGDVEGTATVIAWPLNRMRVLQNEQDVFADIPTPTSSASPRPTVTASGQ